MQSTRHSRQILMKRTNFSTDFRKKITKISNFMKIRPVGGQLVHTDGLTDMTRLIDGFRNFWKAPENETTLEP